MRTLKFGLKKLDEKVRVGISLKSKFRLIPLIPLEEIEEVLLKEYDILLSWEDNSENEEGFIIEHSFDGETWETLVYLESDTESYLVTLEEDEINSTLLNYFRIKAYNDAGESDYSNIAIVQCNV